MWAGTKGARKALMLQFIIDTDDFNIYDLVGIDVVAHISPSSITEKKKIGEGEGKIYTYAILTYIQYRAVWRCIYRHFTWAV